jgi:hypothetical protein
MALCKAAVTVTAGAADSRQQSTSSEARPRKLQKPTNRIVPRVSSQPVRIEIYRLLLSAMLRYVIFVGDEARAQLLLANAKCNKSPPRTTPLVEYMGSST